MPRRATLQPNIAHNGTVTTVMPIEEKKTYRSGPLRGAAKRNKDLREQKAEQSDTIDAEMTSAFNDQEPRILEKYQPSWYPWAAIEKFFVQGAPDTSGTIHYPTLNEIAEHFGISYSSVRRKLVERDWVQKREAWQLELHRQIQASAMTDLIAAANKFDAACLETAQRALDEILSHLLEAKAAGEAVSKLDLDRLGRSAVNWQRVGRLSLGLSTENQDARLEMQSGEQAASIDLSRMTDDELAQLKLLASQVEARTRPPITITEETP